VKKRFLKRHPDEAGLLIVDALLAWKDHHKGMARFPYVEGQKLPLVTLLDELLEHFSAALGRYAMPAVMLHRYQTGPLLYQTPLDQQRAHLARARMA
jgi:hypothetical protein